MWRNGLPAIVVFLLMVMFVPIESVHAQSPVDQASRAGFPLLTEFTLAPGDQPFAFRYKALVDGPHRMIAAWGATVGLRLDVQGAGQGIATGQGNPVSVPFEARKGVEYTVRLSPAGNLPITSVGQLYGGLRQAQATVVEMAELTPGTLVPVPGPAVPGASPIPGPASLQVMQPLSAALVAQLTGPLDLAATLKVAAADPQLSGVISQLPPGGSEAARGVGGDATRVRAPAVPESTSDLDWRSGVKLRFFSEPPAYYVDGKKYYVATIEATAVTLEPFPRLKVEQAQGIVRVFPDPQSSFGAWLELPPDPGTYVVSIRMTDIQGHLQSAWLHEDPPRVSMGYTVWPTTNLVPTIHLPLAVTTGPTGFCSLMTVTPGEGVSLAGTGMDTGMRRANVSLTIRLNRGNDVGSGDLGYFLGGIDIVRVN